MTVIQADEPVVIPAVEQKTFDAQWIYNLVVHAPTLTTGRVAVELLPYNSQTHELGPGEFIESFTTDKLWQAVAEVPEMAVALGAIISAVPAMKNWIKLQQEKEREANSIEREPS